MNYIQKLIERGIIKPGTLIDAPVKKYHMGTPIILTKTLRIREIFEKYCVADEEYEIEAEVPMLEIKYSNISKVDGMEPKDLAKLYGIKNDK